MSSIEAEPHKFSWTDAHERLLRDISGDDFEADSSISGASETDPPSDELD
jgi:hypothetical protein